MFIGTHSVTFTHTHTGTNDSKLKNGVGSSKYPLRSVLERETGKEGERGRTREGEEERKRDKVREIDRAW